MNDNIEPIDISTLPTWIANRYGLEGVILLVMERLDTVTMYTTPNLQTDHIGGTLASATYINVCNIMDDREMDDDR
jgi:hypothetical protein